MGVALDIWKKKEFERGVAEGRRLVREARRRGDTEDILIATECEDTHRKEASETTTLDERTRFATKADLKALETRLLLTIFGVGGAILAAILAQTFLG